MFDKTRFDVVKQQNKYVIIVGQELYVRASSILPLYITRTCGKNRLLQWPTVWLFSPDVNFSET